MNISPLSVALMKSQVFDSLTSPVPDAKKNGSFASMFSLLVASPARSDPSFQLTTDPLSMLIRSSDTAPASGIQGVAPVGRNMALADPESAYKMMNVINNRDVYYKAQFAELSQMKSHIFRMQDAGQSLGSIELSTGNDGIKSRLQEFVGQYNNWILRFSTDLRKEGLLADTQAAQVSHYELEQNIKNRFFGIGHGVRGMGDLGFSIDPNTRLASLDTAKLDALLATNKQGAVNAVQEFGVNFAKSASMLNSDNNFILNQLDNLNRAIHYIADNKDSLQKEFGTGDAAIPTGQIAQALALYNQLGSA
jgi:hypothetical protein